MTRLCAFFLACGNGCKLIAFQYNSYTMNIGPLQLNDRPLFLAPMHEVTDIPFRLICKRLGADVMTTEFVSVEALVRHVRKAEVKLEMAEDERPVGIQIFGKNESVFGEAVQIAERFRPDLYSRR